MNEDKFEKSPVLLITYKRAENTKKILDILIENKIKHIFVYNNGPIGDKDLDENNKTREVVKKYSNKYPNIRTLYKYKNTGLKYNIPEGINWVFEYFDRVIILEDDCFPNSSFFKFCDQLLEKYKFDFSVGQISGSNFLNFNKFKRKDDYSYFFSRIINCWGWATWKSRWENDHDIEMKKWPEVYKKNLLGPFFKIPKNTKYFTKVFNNNFKKGILWDRAWFLTNIINNRLTILPSKNLISNRGYDKSKSGPNPNKWNSLELENLDFPLTHPNNIIFDSEVDNFLIEQGFSNPKLFYRIKNRIKKFFKIPGMY